MARMITELDAATSLARVIASDLSLYHEGALEQSLRDGLPFVGLEDELLEARQLFLHRVAARLEPVTLLVHTLGEYFERWATARGLPAEGVPDALVARVQSATDPLALLVVGGQHELGRVIRLGDGVQVIGRVPEADIQIVADTVSRRHAKLVVDGARVEVEDVESTGGTFVNGEKVRSTPLALGGTLQLGTVILELVRAAAVDPELAHSPATHDTLTRTLHRPGILEALADAVGRGGPLAVALCDVDHLGRINEQYGRSVGDEVLAAVAARLTAAARANRGSAIGRYTDGAFLVVLPGLDAAVLDHAERLRVAVAQDPVATTQGPVQASISIGVTARPSASDLAPATLLDRAGAACTVAKSSGRNGVASA
jgi:diguanylate cyclase (GGDEF)-like protein